MTTEQILNLSAVRSVSYYTASPVETCDRCGTGIKHVFAVRYADSTTKRYGSDCIERILKAEPKLRTLFRKNAKLLALYRDYLNILSGPVDAMPRGQEYYGSGLYFVADSTGEDIAFGRYFFHPVYDVEKNARSTSYRQTTPMADKAMAEISQALPKIQAEITRLESFLAKVLRKAGTVAS